MERAWTIVGSILTVAALGGGTFGAVNVLAHEEVVETTVFRAEGIDALDIGNDTGSVEIVGQDVEEITVVAEISHGLRRTRHHAAVQGSTVVVRGQCHALGAWWCRVNYRLVVPRRIAVSANIDNGRLSVRDVNGDADLDGDNGRIELARLGGTVRVSTDNGSVTATGLRSALVEADSDNGRVALTFAEAPRTVRATSDNGSVEVVVPDGPESFRVALDTQRGSTDVGVRADPASDRSIVAETDNGSVSVRYPTG